MTLFERWKRWLGIGAPPAVPEIFAGPARTSLTGLSHRRVMHDTLAAALDLGRPGRRRDAGSRYFKYFNDRHGHRVGGELMRVVAARLRATLATASCLAPMPAAASSSRSSRG